MEASLPASSVAGLILVLTAAGSRFAALLRSVPDPSPRAIGVWSVGETAAHAAGSSRFFLAVARGEAGPERFDEVAANNAAYLASDGERDPGRLAERFEQGERALLDYTRSIDGDPTLELFVGARVPFSCLLAVELGEMLVHGYDIALASGLRWRMRREEAIPAVAGMIPLLPHVADPDAGLPDAGFELRIRGGPRLRLCFEGGRLSVFPSHGEAVDCRISADPATYLLASYGRLGPLAPILQGKLVAWGRRPWLGASFARRFKQV